MPTSSLRDVVISHRLFTKSRLYSLYSDFRKLKEANPDGYEANLIAWRSLIDSFFTQQVLQHAFVLNTEHLQNDLTLAEYGKPLAVDLVLEDMVRSGDLIPYKQFTETSDSIYTTRWVRPVLSWAVNRFIYDTSYKIGDKKNGLRADKLISKKTLEKYEKEVTKKLIGDAENTHTKNVFTKMQLRETIDALDIQVDGSTVQLSDLDFEILLKFLERDNKKIKVKDDVVKFGDEDVTDEDIGICQIKSTMSSLELHITELQVKIDSTDKKLKLSLKNKASKDVSLNLLRSKKVAEQALTKQIASLTQLESVLYKIDESSTNIQLVNALEKGTDLLKSLNSQIGGIERVEQVMDDVEEQKYTADKITEEISRLGNGVSEDDIEAEFEEMLALETRDKNSTDDVAEQLSKLKIAPSGDLTTQDTETTSEERKEAVSNN
ncbi:Charged multivesicular body protein 7 [Cyberlindnera fabianii]|uniref:Vacuolar-sorting protein SNF7 n=1 Tax=Cyberlindnera fabianii TaxID=36022 RepID=A0A1V2LAX8_CYBFA|nr:Charged multivesicular body protein 7 [Cyberlindnera fabianii]